MLRQVWFLTHHTDPIKAEKPGGITQINLKVLPVCFDLERFHITCLSPPLGTVTAEDWFCQECATEDSHTNDSFSREESEIAEAEMMDLLSQFVPTSSRLRPSTSAQRAASVPPRRSARVQQHGSRTHLALPHTVQVTFSRLPLSSINFFIKVFFKT